MSARTIPRQLELAEMATSGSIMPVQGTSGGVGALFAWGTTVPSTASTFAPGCVFVHTDGSSGTETYINRGSYASPSFAALASVGANTFTGAQTFTSTIAQTGTTSTITQGTFSSTTAGSGVTLLRSGTTAAVRHYADDGGDALTGTGSVPDIRCGIVRNLITTDHSGGHVRLFGLQGMLASYNGIWNTEAAAGVEGIMQVVTSESKTLGGYGLSAGLLARGATSGTVTIDTNHIFAGVASVSDMKGTVTQTGKTAAFYAGIYDTTNWSDSTSRAKWKYAMFVNQDSCTAGIHVGVLGSNTTSGLPIGGATTLNGFFADDSGAAQTTSTVWSNVTARTYYSVDQTSAAADAYVIRAHLKAASGVDFSGDTSVKAASNAYCEFAGDTTIGTGSFFAGHFAEFWSDGNFVGTGKAAGVMSRVYTASAKTLSGTTAAFMATKQWASAGVWPYGLYIDAATVDIRLNAGPYIVSGAGAPSAVTATKGSLYLRTDGTTTNDRAYINTDGGTTWTALTTAA